MYTYGFNGPGKITKILIIGLSSIKNIQDMASTNLSNGYKMVIKIIYVLSTNKTKYNKYLPDIK